MKSKQNKTCKVVTADSSKGIVWLEDYLRKTIKPKLYAKEASNIRDVLRQICELRITNGMTVEQGLAINRARCQLQLLGEDAFVEQCDKRDSRRYPNALGYDKRYIHRIRCSTK